MSRSRLTLSPDIVERLRTRDPAAFDELLRAAGPPLIAFLMSYVQSRDVAEDLLQNVLLRIWELEGRFLPKGTVEAYLFAMARNEALGTLRKERIQARYITRYAEDLAGDDDRRVAQAPGDVTPGDDAADTIHRIVATFTEHQRTVFALRYGEGMKVAEIARVLGISDKGVERLLTRIKKLILDYVRSDA